MEALAALVFLLQHNAEQAVFDSSRLQHISNISISDAQHRLCRTLHAAAAAFDVLLPASMCFLAPPALLMQQPSYSTQWSAFFRTHMPGHMLSNSFVPGQYSCFLFHASSCLTLSLAALPNLWFCFPSQMAFPTFLRKQACCQTSVAVRKVLPPELLQPLRLWSAQLTRSQYFHKQHFPSGTRGASALVHRAGTNGTQKLISELLSSSCFALVLARYPAGLPTAPGDGNLRMLRSPIT